MLYDVLAWQEMQTESPRCTHCWRVSRMSTIEAIWKSLFSKKKAPDDKMIRTFTRDQEDH
uniref:Uncharacterized protein n=1 Tax=Hyaloperonospora arabidopsidis (strain Emoy2) TaxID=559515 RepID=M4B8S7_HYAAE